MLQAFLIPCVWVWVCLVHWSSYKYENAMLSSRCYLYSDAPYSADASRRGKLYIFFCKIQTLAKKKNSEIRNPNPKLQNFIALDFGCVNWKSAPIWTFSKCLTTSQCGAIKISGNRCCFSTKNEYATIFWRTLINTHPCVFHLLHMR